MALLLPPTIYHRGTNSDTAVHENTHPLRTQKWGHAHRWPSHMAHVRHALPFTNGWKKGE